MSYINSDCTPCTTTQQVIVPCTGCSVILPDSCVIRKGAAIACLGIAVDDTLEDMIDKIAEKICAVDSYIFDTTCLGVGGAINSNTGQAINLLIGKICDSVVSYPTFNASCLGGDPVDTMSNTINYLISWACDPLLEFGSLDWTCLTTPTDAVLGNVLQGILNNIKANKLTFGAGFVLTPTSCGYNVEYTGAGSGSGIALTSTSSSFSTGTPTSYINVTPSSGTNSSYTVNNVFQNSTRANIGGLLAGITNPGTSTTVGSYRARWDGHVDFDGYLNFSNTVLTSAAWTISGGTFDLFNLPAGTIPDRVKIFPAQLVLAVPIGWPGPELPPNHCNLIHGQIVVYHLGGGAKMQFVTTDCKDIIDMLADYEAAFPLFPLTGTLWLSQVQYFVS